MMSVASSNGSGPGFQPFQCQICQSRFTRHENLKRHAALHTRSQDETSLACELCDATFSRPDLRNRHMKRKHPDHEEDRTPKRPRLKNADRAKSNTDHPPSVSPVDSNHRRHSERSEDDGNRVNDHDAWPPASYYEPTQVEYGNQSHRSASANLSTGASVDGNNNQLLVNSLGLPRPPSMNDTTYNGTLGQDASTMEPGMLLRSAFPKPTQYETQIHPRTNSQSGLYDSNGANVNWLQDISPLSDSLLSTDLQQFQSDWFPSTMQISRGLDLFFNHVAHFVPFLHQPTFEISQTARPLVLAVLSLAYHYGEDPDCNDQPGTGLSLSTFCFNRARAIIASDDDTSDDLEHNLSMVQTYLLLQICAMMYLCGKASKYALKMHSKMVNLARDGGLTVPVAIESATTEDLDSLWKEFLKAESHKRTLFTVHQIDALWYQILSVPRSVSHLEIKHDLPCPESCWTATSAAEWAHRQLVAKSSSAGLQYTDAVRRLLSRDTDVNTIPAFDPYGAINIVQFLISSAREASGWSTMTGMLSMERFEALRSSLIKLGPLIRSQTNASKTTHAALSEATWETAMIELQMWSPSHTGGIVAGSMDAFLFQSTYLASSCELVCEADTAKAIQPHLNWFLQYLDGMSDASSDAPWIMLYAYKAFLIAWQLVHAGSPGAMRIVGVRDGDTAGALAWAREVFQRRQRWQLGKLTNECLDVLAK